MQKSEINCDTVKLLETASFGLPVAQSLARLGWDASSLTAGVGLELSPDNRHVIRGQFLLRGPLTKETVIMQANNLWAKADSTIKLHLIMPDGDAFKFLSGTLSSDLIPGEDIKHFFMKENSVIPPTEWARYDLGEISIRAVCHMDKSSNGANGPAAKITILAFPRSVEDMIALSDHTQSPAWPGIRILEASCEFSPTVGQWKDPICPLFMVGSALSVAPNAPSLQEIRHRISAVMQTAKRPTACTTSRALKNQWTKAMEDVEGMEQDPNITWPDEIRQQPHQGKLFTSMFSHLTIIQRTRDKC